MDKVLNSDVVVWATPIYYYERSGQMKDMIWEQVLHMLNRDRLTGGSGEGIT